VRTGDCDATRKIGAGTTVPAWGDQTGGPSGATTVVLALQRRRARARGIYLLNARRARLTCYSDWRRRKAGTSNAPAPSSLSP
jgi:hypothetical protein